jgi:hypothetical protein
MAGAFKRLDSSILASSFLRTSYTAVVLGNICAVPRHFEVHALLRQEIQVIVIFSGASTVQPLTFKDFRYSCCTQQYLCNFSPFWSACSTPSRNSDDGHPFCGIHCAAIKFFWYFGRKYILHLQGVLICICGRWSNEVKEDVLVMVHFNQFDLKAEAAGSSEASGRTK